ADPRVGASVLRECRRQDVAVPAAPMPVEEPVGHRRLTALEARVHEMQPAAAQERARPDGPGGLSPVDRRELPDRPVGPPACRAGEEGVEALAGPSLPHDLLDELVVLPREDRLGVRGAEALEADHPAGNGDRRAITPLRRRSPPDPKSTRLTPS